MSMTARLASHVRSHIIGEDAYTTPHQFDRSIGMPTGAPASYLAKPALQSLKKPRINSSSCQSSHVIGNAREAVDARTALARTLLGQIAGDSCRFGNAAG